MRSNRRATSIFTTLLLFSPSSFAFETPLSDQAVREAYFLGQRHDESMARILDGYKKYLPSPASGPQIHSVAFFTPFALVVEHSSRQSNYSAQQAAKDHGSENESVRIQVEIALTPSYGTFIAEPTGKRSGSPIGVRLRPSDFWRAFRVRTFDGDEEITTEDYSGEPLYICSERGCWLTGAMIRLHFPAAAFTADKATIEVTPPEGDAVSVEFDLTHLR